MELPTHPPMDLFEVIDRQDGIYYCIKDRNSVFLWVNQNFADLVGSTKDQLIGSVDSRGAHVADDKKVMADGVPLLNLHESIPVPSPSGPVNVNIVTQKGLLRQRDTGDIIGITVCFALAADLSTADYLINKLGMMPSGVGGYIALTAGSEGFIDQASLPPGMVGDRRFYSRNYYLLKGDDVLSLHRLEQDEQWYHHSGDSVKLHIFPDDANYWSVTVGRQLAAGEELQGLAPGQHWFGGELVTPGTYSLSSCSLAPGFDPRDTRLPMAADVADLKRRFPEQASLLDRLSGTVST